MPLRIVAPRSQDAPATSGFAADDTRAASAIGRNARLELAFEQRRGRTVVTHQYAEPPLRVARTFDLHGAAYVILVCAGPGVFGGDALSQSIHVGHGARVVLVSQAALQVHPSPSMATAPAILRHRYRVEPEGELHCHWDPLIPFAGARVDQRFDLQLADDSRLYWSDAMMAGRVTRGEAWQFDTLTHELALRVGSRLSYLERYRVRPGERHPGRTWLAGHATHFTTTLVRHSAATRDIAEELQRRFAGMTDGASGVDLVEPGLILARVLTADGASFGRARASYRAWTLASIFGRPELAGRK